MDDCESLGTQFDSGTSPQIHVLENFLSKAVSIEIDLNARKMIAHEILETEDGFRHIETRKPTNDELYVLMQLTQREYYNGR